MKNVMIINSDIYYDKLFSSLGYLIVHTLGEADLVCFTGGSDVTPALYGQDKHSQTYNSEKRDTIEQQWYCDAASAGIPMVGICRGAQFLHVMNGGSLYQHVDGHAIGTPHDVTDVETGDKHLVTSTHHQMMAYQGWGTLVATAEEATKLEYCYSAVELVDKSSVDTEVMWYHDTGCLCFQPHPEFEWGIEGAESTFNYFKLLLGRYYDAL